MHASWHACIPARSINLFVCVLGLVAHFVVDARTSTFYVFVCMRLGPCMHASRQTCIPAHSMYLSACILGLVAHFVADVHTSTFYKLVCMRLRPRGKFCDGRAYQHLSICCMLLGPRGTFRDGRAFSSFCRVALTPSQKMLRSVELLTL
jgi:hypothetical protein